MLKVIILFFMTSTIWAHGMNQAGPHQGEIRMIGNFHTELVFVKNEFRIYLLDINFKNPMTKHSNVSLTLKTNKQKSLSLICFTEIEYFKCPLKFNDSNIKSIEIKAARNNISPNESASYQFPLKFSPH